MTDTLGLSPDRLARLDSHLAEKYIATRRLPCTLSLIARHGEIAHLHTQGLADVERGIPARDDTIFRIYSMTKPITSVALMTLFERGMFQLEDPVQRFFPEWRNQRVWVSGEGEDMVTAPLDRPVSIRDVLTHMSGLTYGGGLPGVGIQHPVDKVYRALKVRSLGSTDSLSEFMTKLSQVPLLFQPGTKWMYSLATDVCGALVERISGVPFDKYLQEVIFDPLGMVDTAFHVAPEKAHRFASNYQRNADKTLGLLDDAGTSAYLKPAGFLSGGGGLTGTCADYMRFCEMLRRGGELDGVRIIGPRTLDLMTRNHLPGDQDLTEIALGSFSETANSGVGFGLGFASTMDVVSTGTLGEGDFYWGGAASTIFWVDPHEELSVVFMTQLMPSGSFNFRGQLKNIIYAAMVD
jgi:CubicO group peptidase (beta-lactamase class C family)